MTHSPNGVMQASAVYGDCKTCCVYRIPEPLVIDVNAVMHLMMLYDLLPKQDDSDLVDDQNRMRALEVLWQACNIKY